VVLKIGKPAPDFEAPAWFPDSKEEKRIKLSDFRGRWVVLFFYPRDFTFICPTEIRGFASNFEEFVREKAAIIGASTDSFWSHRAWFEADESLRDIPFPVIADTTHEVSKSYEVLLDDGAALRGTFIIDPDAVLRHITMNDADVGRSVLEILRTLQALRTGSLCPMGWKPGEETLG
jgi:peroxiredoxin (alkyl hydroperoxide reductase subunit C)